MVLRESDPALHGIVNRGQEFDPQLGERSDPKPTPNRDNYST
jgi:hypothetical protein